MAVLSQQEAMHYNINDEYFKEFKVSLNGDIRDDVIEDNDNATNSEPSYA